MRISDRKVQILTVSHNSVKVVIFLPGLSLVQVGIGRGFVVAKTILSGDFARRMEQTYHGECVSLCSYIKSVGIRTTTPMFGQRCRARSRPSDPRKSSPDVINVCCLPAMSCELHFALFPLDPVLKYLGAV